MSELRDLIDRLGAEIVKELAADQDMTHVLGDASRETTFAVARSALLRCFTAFDPKAALLANETDPPAGPLSWAMSRHIWRRVADIGLSNGLQTEPLLAAAEALFDHLGSPPHEHAETTPGR